MEPLEPDERFSELEALCIAFECVLEHSIHSEDPLRIGDLQFEVCIVWYDHKLRVGQPSEDGVVRPKNPTTSKVRVSVRKFRGVPNVTGGSMCPIGSASNPRTTPWNDVGDGHSWDSGMPMSLSVDA
jgi:hypothetical protein